MPDHLTQRTRRVMTLANDIALRHGLSDVADLVVLIAIMEEGGGIAATLLQTLGVELAPLYQHLPKAQADLRILDVAHPLPVSSECQRVLQAAEGVAAEQNAPQVGTEHLLLAMVRTAESPAAALLAERGVTEAALREAASQHA
jgi:ATP-dependent Clp protease ATP-binding subunit ClpC